MMYCYKTLLYHNVCHTLPSYDVLFPGEQRLHTLSLFFSFSLSLSISSYLSVLFPSLFLYLFISVFVSCLCPFNCGSHYSLFRLFYHSPVFSPSIHPPCCLTGCVCCFYQSDIGSLPRARPGNSEFSLMAPLGPAPL